MKTIYILLIFTSLLLFCSCEKEPICQKICVYGTLDEASCSCNCSDGYYDANCQYQEANQSENESEEIGCNTIDYLDGIVMLPPDIQRGQIITMKPHLG